MNKKEKAEGAEKQNPQKTEPKAEDYKDMWLRSVAEYENLKKRVEREKSETIRFSNQFLIAELFPIMDSFDSAIKTADKTNDKGSFLKGLKMLQAEFHKVLEANGLKKIKTIGEKFNPELHHAESEIETDKFPEGVVAEEIMSGYTLNDRVLRPAVVKVSKGKTNEDKSLIRNPKH